MEAINETPFTIGLVPGRLNFPGHSLTVVIKGTFDLVPNGAAAASEEQIPPTGDEEYEPGADGIASLRYPSDLAYYKPRADLLLVGQAVAPAGQAVTRLQVAFTVGERTKRLEVTGDRWWSGGSSGTRATDPRLFTAVELRYENAFGGRGLAENPVGKGGVRIQDEAGYEVLPLPNVEYPTSRMTAPNAIVAPAGFGPLHPQWAPRGGKVGSYRGSWLKERWPWFPDDFDWSFFNAAPEDMQLDGYLQGDEEITLEHVDAEFPLLRARLPGLRVRCFLHVSDPQAAPVDGAAPGVVSGNLREVPLIADTLWINAEKRKAIVVWRGWTEVDSEEFDEIRHLYIIDEPLHGPATAPDRIQSRFVQHLDDAAAELEMGPGREIVGVPVGDDTGPDEELAASYAELNASLAAAGLPAFDPDAPPPEPSPEARDASADMMARHGEAPPEEEDGESALSRVAVAALAGEGRSLAGRDMSGLDLAGLDLTKADLAGAILTGSTLKGATLDGANLAGAVLEGCDLSGASLRGALLAGADLSRADLASANLGGSQLDDALLEGANLRESILEGAQGPGAVFMDADLTMVRAAGSSFPAADFTGARLEGADFREAELTEACLERAYARGADFSRAALAQLQAADGADFTGALFVEITAPQAIWSASVLVEADFGYARLQGVEFSGADLTRANLSAADMTEGRLAKAVLVGARMIRCNLFEASLEKANLVTADLRGSNLYGAELLDAQLEGTLLDGVNLKMTKLDPS